MKKYEIIANVVEQTATVTTNLASWFWLYQPKTPKCLNK